MHTTTITVSDCNQLVETLNDIIRQPAKIRVKLCLNELLHELKRKVAPANEIIEGIYKQNGETQNGQVLLKMYKPGTMEFTEAFKELQELQTQSVEISYNHIDESILDMNSSTDCRVLIDLYLKQPKNGRAEVGSGE